MTLLISLPALAAIIAFASILAFVLGRISTAPAPQNAGPLALSDAALAHINHEAIRAYQRSLGIIKLKSWNNLSPTMRDLLTERVRKLRNGEGLFLEPHLPMARIEGAILGLTR